MTSTKKKLKKWCRLEIIWVDSLMNREGWHEADDELNKEDMFHKAIGYLKKEDKDYIEIVQAVRDREEPDKVSGFFIVPKVAIKNLILLKPIKEKKN